MTREDALKKAAEWAIKHAYDISTRGAVEREVACKDAFMACYDMMMSGEADGWMFPIYIKELRRDTKLNVTDFYPVFTYDTSGAIPVKIVELEKK